MKKDSFNSFDLKFPKGTEPTLTAQDLLDKEVDIKYFISNRMIDTILGHGTKGYIVKPTIDTPVAKTLTATMHKMHRASQDNYYTDEYNWNKFKDDSKSKNTKINP